MKIKFAKNKSILKADTLFITLVEGDKTELLKSAGKKTLELSVGKKESLTRRKLVPIIRKAVLSAKYAKIKKIAILFSDFEFKNISISEEDLAELISINLELANYEFLKYRTEPKEGWDFVEEAIIIGNTDRRVQAAFLRGQIIGKEINSVRDLANTPGGDMTPQILARKALESAKGLNVQVKILDRSDIESLGMGGILGVAKGSIEEPRFIVMEYWGHPNGEKPARPNKSGGSGGEKPTVFVGKGVTFDTGGVNIKTGDGMLGMNLDMSGGACVIHAVTLAAKLKLKKNVIGLIPAVENMPSGTSYRPGDVLRTMSGKTIEVLNTDAEGRIILADALSYAKKYKPELVVDVATLTGAALVALGLRASAFFTKEDSLANRIVEAGERSGNYAWRLPLWEEYEAEVKGKFGDVTNTHNKNARWGGSINGAIFLYQFVKDAGYPWVHIDMAPRMESITDDNLAPGSTGEPMQLLLELLRSN